MRRERVSSLRPPSLHFDFGTRLAVEDAVVGHGRVGRIGVGRAVRGAARMALPALVVVIVVVVILPPVAALAVMFAALCVTPSEAFRQLGRSACRTLLLFRRGLRVAGRLRRGDAE